MFTARTQTSQKISNLLSRKIRQSTSETSFGVLGSSEREECLFLRQNDYWIIQYEGQAAVLKSTRGLHYLSVLLRYPEREFHVGELVHFPVDPSTPFVVNAT